MLSDYGLFNIVGNCQTKERTECWYAGNENFIIFDVEKQENTNGKVLSGYWGLADDDIFRGGLRFEMDSACESWLGCWSKNGEEAPESCERLRDLGQFWDSVGECFGLCFGVVWDLFGFVFWVCVLDLCYGFVLELV